MPLQQSLRHFLQSIATLTPILLVVATVVVWTEFHIGLRLRISGSLTYYFIPVAIIILAFVSGGALTCIWMRRCGCASFLPTDGIRLFARIGFDLPSRDFINKLSRFCEIPISEIRTKHVMAFREWLSSISVGALEERGGLMPSKVEPIQSVIPQDVAYPGKRVEIVGVWAGLLLWLGLTSLLWGFPVGGGVGVMSDFGNLEMPLIYFGILAISWLFGMAPTLYVRNRLIEKGYHWAGMKQARYVWNRIGPRFFKQFVPKREELLVVENYQDGNVESLVRYLTCRDEH